MQSLATPEAAVAALQQIWPWAEQVAERLARKPLVLVSLALAAAAAAVHNPPRALSYPDQLLAQV